MPNIPQEQIPAVEQEYQVVKIVRKSRIRLWLTLTISLIAAAGGAMGYASYKDHERDAQYEKVDFNKSIEEAHRKSLGDKPDSNMKTDDNKPVITPPSDKEKKPEKKPQQDKRNNSDSFDGDRNEVAFA